MKGEGRRAGRLGQLIQASLAETVRRELDDPDFLRLIVAGVKVSEDLSIVTVHVRFLGVEEERRREVLLGRLRRAAPRLRRALLARIGLRRAPELRFFLDAGADAARRVEELLREIRGEK